MLTRPSLARSIPFWILFIGSLLSAALGILLVVSNISGMASDIKSQSATAAITVYTGQSWVVLGAALVGAGLIGLIAALLLGVLAGFVPVTHTTTAVPVEDATAVFDETPAVPVAAPAADAAAIPAVPPAEVATPADAAPAPAQEAEPTSDAGRI